MGTQAVKGEFERGGAFQNGRAVVKKDRGYGIISKEGEFLLPPYYAYLSDFSDGLAVCSINLRYGFIDPAGNIVIPLMYAFAQSFCNGTAKVWRNFSVKKYPDGSRTEYPANECFIDKQNRQFWKSR